VSSFSVTDNSHISPVVLHVPHGGTFIPQHLQTTFLLSEEALLHEVELMADLRTDQIANEAISALEVQPSVFMNNLSRLVVDPERFDDPSEEMESVGMGVVYTKTSDQKPLRAVTPSERAQLVSDYYHPYSSELSKLVSKTLRLHGHVTIIDLHSYAKEALEYELHKDLARPEICLGIDSLHTPKSLIDSASRAFGGFEIGHNAPFAGTYVPLEHYQSEPMVHSIMIEIRKDTYQAEAGFLKVSNSLSRLLNDL
jgi:N-formylglutamate amidohydrolase